MICPKQKPHPKSLSTSLPISRERLGVGTIIPKLPRIGTSWKRCTMCKVIDKAISNPTVKKKILVRKMKRVTRLVKSATLKSRNKGPVKIK